MQRRLKNKLFIKAFPYQGAGGSLRDRFSYGEAEGRAEALSSVSSLFTGETRKEPRFSIESLIYELAEAGERQGVRDALFEYLRWSGVSC